jgi:putative transposase
MQNVRRYFKEGQTYFLTHVTFERIPILVDNVDLIWKALKSQQERAPYDLVAWAVLPDHMHILIRPENCDLGSLTKRFKLSFAALYRKRIGTHEGRAWQNRYWDHVIRDQVDMNRHLDYIHHNPVKHGYANAAFEYEHSSFGRFIEQGFYARDWRAADEVIGATDMRE